MAVDETILLSNVATAAVGALAGGGVVARRKAKAEAEGIAVETLREVVEELRAELNRKESEIVGLRGALDRKEGEIRELRGRVDAFSQRLDQLEAARGGN